MKDRVYVLADYVVNIDHRLEGEFKDWPQQLQDKIMKDVQIRNLATGRKFEVARSYCGESDGVYFIHVVLKSPVTLQ